MNQEANIPLKNLQNILKYINLETEKKINAIRKEGQQVVETGISKYPKNIYLIIEKTYMQKHEKEIIKKRFEKELEEFMTKLKM
jgi:hypothetical protein